MDIVERLRGAPMVSNENGYTGISRMGGAMLNEAADEIERLREENEKLLSNAKQDAEMMMAYNLWCQKNGCAPSSSNLIEMLQSKNQFPTTSETINQLGKYDFALQQKETK